MSLVGSLEDLALGDILQIVSLSRKSGLLLLRSEAGEGRIVLCDGQVRGASVKGEADDLRGVLIGAGAVSAVDFELAAEDARCGGPPLEEGLAARAGLSAERIEDLRREHVERVTLRMFRWRSGEFSFEVRDEPDGSAELKLATGINTQFLTMEATRLGDEAGQRQQAEADEGAPGAWGEGEPTAEEEAALRAGPVFSGEDAYARDASSHEPALEGDPWLGDPLEPPPPTAAFAAREPLRGDGDAAHALALAALRRVDAALGPENEPARPPQAAAQRGAAERSGSESERPRPDAHLVVIDPDLAALEWLKEALRREFARVHIFQRSEAGLERIRQYLGRGKLPVVLLSARAAVDSATGARDVPGLLQRLRAQAPRMPLLVLRDDATPELPGLDAADAVVQRPHATRLASPRVKGQFEGAARALREALRPFSDARSRETRTPAPKGGEQRERPARAPEPTGSRDATDLRRLKQLSDRLRDPGSRGEVLSILLEFAAERFARVAMFMVRDEHALGMAQRGLAESGGPDDAALRSLRVRTAEVPWLGGSVESRAPERVSPARAGGWLLGGAPPREAWVAPIESGGRVVALLYGDQLPSAGPLPDTTLIEVALAEAGMALDRALLERALREASNPEAPEAAPRSRLRRPGSASTPDRKNREFLKQGAPLPIELPGCFPRESGGGRARVQRILIVEDSPTMRALLVSALEELGEVKVTEAASGFEALRALPREPFDLIITDINMPDINGLELVSFAKRSAAYRSIPLVIVSTEGSERDREKGVSLGADAYLVKPFTPDMLRGVVSDLLERARSQPPTGRAES